jgi:hypothetical protein
MSVADQLPFQFYCRFGLRRERPEVSTSNMTAIITAAISIAQSIAVMAECYRRPDGTSTARQLVAGKFSPSLD